MIFEKFEDIIVPTEEIWKNLNYKNIEAKNKLNFIVSNKKLIHKFDDDIDNSILYALKYYDNLNLFVVFGKSKNESFKYYQDHYKIDYHLYGIKYIKLKSTLLNKIMYQLLFGRMIIKNKQDIINFLEENCQFINSFNKEFIDITILLVCKKNLKKKYPNDDVNDQNFYIYIPNTKETIWNCACLFFCESSLNFLEKQNFDYFLIKDMERSKKMFLKYRKWLNNNIDYKHQSQFMLFSSIVLYLLGHRAINDIDLYIHSIPDFVYEKTNELKNNEEYKFVEYNIKNTELWPNYWDSWLDVWATKCGAKYFEEILGNPKYHFYFLGVKIISLDCDIVRRVERNRPRAVADLIALRKRYYLKIDIPPIPEKLIKYVSIKDKTDEEISKLVNEENGIINEENKEISIEYNSDIEKFINTIIYALQTRYKMVFTVDEIKRELNMYSDRKIKKTDDISEKKIKIIIKRK